jgi:hypothetical protein
MFEQILQKMCLNKSVQISHDETFLWIISSSKWSKTKEFLADTAQIKYPYYLFPWLLMICLLNKPRFVTD